MFYSLIDTSAACCLEKIKIENILDKNISIDDDNLITPLQPVKLSPRTQRKLPKPALTSVLRMSFDYDSLYDDNSFFIKKVTFPASIDELISYKEPEYIYPFVICK